MRIAIPLPRGLPLRRLGVNSFWLLVARVSAQVLSLVLTALVARRLGAAVLGEYTLVASLVYLANVASTFGTDSLLIREVGRTRRPDSSLISTAFWLQSGLSILLIALALIWNGGTLNLPLYSLALLPLALYSIASAVLRGFERMDLYLLLNLFGAAMQLFAGVLVLLAGGELTALLAALVVVQVLTAILAWRLARRHVGSIGFALCVQPALVSTFVAALPFALLTTSAVIYQRMGIFAVGAIAGNDATGWFSAAFRLVEGLKIAPQALLGALLPMMAFRANGQDTTGLFRTSIRLALGFSFVAALFLTLFAGPIVTVIYGQDFAPAVGALSILAWSLVPFAITSVISVEMVAQGHEWRALGGTVAAAVLALLLYVLLVPHYGVTGACWASVAAEAGQATLFLAIRGARRK